MEFAAADNQGLVRLLRARGVLKSERTAEAFMAVPREDFVNNEMRQAAYADAPIKSGHLHLSAPHIYAMLLEAMKPGPGMSLLALGSGSGYFCSLVAYLLGPTGTVHGIDVWDDNVEWARGRYEAWRAACRGRGVDVAPCEFVCGNCFQLDPTGPHSGRYDLVYCGANCPSQRKSFVREFVAPGGTLVVPCDGAFIKATRGPSGFVEEVLCQVSFAPLLDPPISDPLANIPHFETSLPPRGVAAATSTTTPGSAPSGSSPASPLQGNWDGYYVDGGKRVPLTPVHLSCPTAGSVEGHGKSGNEVLAVSGSFSSQDSTTSLTVVMAPSGKLLRLSGLFDPAAGIVGSWTVATGATGVFSLNHK